MSEAMSVRSPVRVVWARKKLLLLSGIVTGLVGGLLWLLVRAEVRVGGSVLLGVAGALALVVLTTVGNAVLLVAADDALRGRRVGIRSGCARAFARLRAVAGWAPLGALLVLGAVLLVGMAWSPACYLVLPAVVLDGAGYRAALRHSREAYRRDRGRFLQGSSRLTTPVLVTFLPSLAVLVAGLTATDRGLGAVLTAGAALCLGGGVTVTASLFAVFRASLYRETTGEAGPVTAVGPVGPVGLLGPVGAVVQVSEVE